MRIFTTQKKNNYNYNSTPSLLKPLWFAAGADPILLKNGTYNDQVKMACLGGTVYATTILAFFSGSYAIHTVFSENLNQNIQLMSWAMGFVWAMIIFNLDRYIVSSTPPNTEKDTSHKNLKKLCSIPFLTRIVLGFILGVVISTPLKIKIFEKDIQSKISEKITADFDKRRLNIIKNNPEYNNLKKDSIRIAKEITDKIKAIKQQESLYNTQVHQGTENSPSGRGPKAKDAERLKNKYESEKKDLESQQKNNADSISNFIKKIDIDIKNDNSIINGYNSLVSKAAMPSEINFLISWFILLFFLAIELTPIILKTLMESSPYDYQKFDRDEAIKERSKNHKESIIKQHKLEIESEEYEHLKNIEEQRRQLDERIRIEKESYQENLIKLKSKITEAFAKEHDIETIKKFNEIFDNIEQKKYLENLRQQDIYIHDLNDLQIKDAKRNQIKNDELENVNLEKTIADERRQMVLEIEKERLKTIRDNEYNKIKNTQIDSNNYEKEKGKTNIFENKEEKSKKKIKDQLIDGKTWTEGEGFIYTKILSKNTIQNFVKDEKEANRWYNSDDNKIVTDSKIQQYKKDKNIDEAIIAYNASTNNQGIKFNIDLAKKYVINLKNKIQKNIQ